MNFLSTVVFVAVVSLGTGLFSVIFPVESEKPSGEIEVKVVNFDELQPLLCPNGAQEGTHLVNFFATWCKPCVEELPYFLELHEEYKEEGMKFILISLDFPRHLESKLIPFLKENKVDAEVYLLDDTAANTWIPKVSEKWSGAIPATVVCNFSERELYEQTFHSVDELKKVVDPLMQNK